MKVGDRVLERFRLQAALPAPPGQLRFAAIDDATGEPAEIIAPTAQVALRPGADRVFVAARSAPTSHPAWLPAGPVGRADGRPAAARPPVAAPLPAALRLDATQVRAWAGWLGPALLDADPSLGGRLGPEDLVLDPDGVVRISPAGLAQPRERVRADAFAGASGSALHGLGTILFEALTGAPPPADGRGARDVDPAVPDDVDSLLDALRAPSVDRARAALLALPDGEPPRLSLDGVASPASPTAPPPDRLAAPQHTVRTTRDAPAPLAARVDAARLPWAVVTWPAGLTGAARKRAAALADVPLDRVDALAAAALPLVLHTAPDAATAGAVLPAFEVAGLPVEVRSADPPTSVALRAAGAGALSVGAVVTAVLLLPLALGLPQLLLPLVALCLVLGLPLGWLALQWGTEARRRVQLDRARDVVGARDPGKLALDGALESVRAAHRAILQAELAVPVRLDLEEALDELRAELAEGAVGPERLQIIRDLADELGRSVVPASPSVRGPDRDEDLRRRVRAARAAAAELHRGS
ncbi:MAG: hypothetical protein H6742_07495 [Alphaproteobacteria bacterium]|nr:hypothetical protein [Alphaproteobacteria bacterium]